MSSVDDRIVNMQFNNKQFNQGASESEKALLGLDGTISKVAKGQGLSTMDKSVSGVAQKFGALKIAGIAAIATIASKATLMGINLVKSLTLDPIMDGFHEYQTNLNSIQTIMANTGKSVDVVNGYLGQLNKYSDQTIYNFSEMAKNIGTFTAAGVDLKTSVASIQGISNVAALSGSSSQQASTAMYQLSQAIAAGRVNLQDWNSVVNAGMGGKNLQTALIQTGTAMGTIDANVVKMGEHVTIAGQSFRDSISATGGTSWLTSDVLVKTLSLMDGRLSKASIAATHLGWSNKQVNAELEKQQKILSNQGYNKEQIASLTKMADAAYNSATVVKTLPQLMDVLKESIGSVWAQAFQGIMGNFEQSKKLWTNASNAANGLVRQFGHGLIGMITDWRKAGGRDDVIEGFKNGFEDLGRILKPIQKAFRDVFPPTMGKSLAALSEGFKNFTAALRPSRDTMQAIRSIFGGIFAAIHIGLSVVKGLASAFGNLLGAIFKGSGDARSGILDILAAAGESVKAFDKWLTAGGKLSEVLGNLGTVVGTAIRPLLTGINLVAQAFAELATGGGVDGFMAKFDQAQAAFASFASNVLGWLSDITAPFEGLSSVFDTLQTKIDSVKSSMESMSGPISAAADKVTSLTSAFGGDSGDSDWTQSSDKLTTGLAAISDSADTTKDSVSGLYGVMAGAAAGAAVDQADAMGSAAEEASSRWENAKTVLSAVGNAVKTAFTALGGVFSWVKDRFSAMFGDFTGSDWAGLMNAVLTGGLLIALKKGVDVATSFEQIKNSVKEVLEETKSSLKAWQSSLKAKMILEIAIAIGILAAALLVLSFIPAKKLSKALGAVAVMMGELVGALYLLSKINIEKEGPSMVVLASSLLILSFAMMNLAVAVAIFSRMSLGELAKGLGAMAIGIGILVGSLFALSKISGKVEGMAASILIMSIAMNFLATAILALGSMNLETLTKGLGAIAIGLGIMVGALMVLAKGKGEIEGAAASILIMSIAMVVLSAAVAAFGNMDLGTLAKGFGAVALGIGIMVGALMILSGNAEGVATASASMLLMAISMNMLVGVIMVLGTAPWENVARGLGFVALALGILLLAAVGAEGVAVGLEVLGTSVLMLGAGLALAGIGMFALASGFALLATVGAAGIGVVTLAIKAFLALLPAIAQQAAMAFVAFIKVIANESGQIRKAFNKIFGNMIGVVKDNIPKLVNLFTVLMSSILRSLTKLMPQFGKLISTMIKTGLDILVKGVPQYVNAGLKIILGVLRGMSDKIPKILDVAGDLVVKFIQGLGNQATKITNAAGQTILKFMDGLDKAIIKYAPRIREMGIKIVRDLIDGMSGGLASKIQGAWSSAVSHVHFSLPSVHIPGLGRQAAVTFKSLSAAAKKAVELANQGANSIIAAGNANVLKAQQKYKTVQATADAAASKAAIAGTRSNRATKKANDAQKAYEAMQKKADKAKKGSAEKKRLTNQANALKKAANTAKKTANIDKKIASNKQTAADKAQKIADAAAKHVEDVKAFEDADLVGKGDIKSQEAVTLATRASKLLQQANAESAQAKLLAKSNKAADRKLADELAKQAKEDAKRAKKTADASVKARKQAATYYKQSIDERILALQQSAAYDAAEKAGDKDTMASILNAQSEAAQKKADTARQQAAEYLQKAQDVANTDAAAAQAYLAIAETQSQAAEDAASAAEDAKNKAQEILGASSSSSSSSSPGPSTSVLEQAASAVDSYTASMERAGELLSGSTAPVQFNQYNTSPKALNSSEIYRQNKNLLSLASVKMG